MGSWFVDGIELPFGECHDRVWVDDQRGVAHDQPIDESETLPGSYYLTGLVDAHAHPAIGTDSSGFRPLPRSDTLANLVAWAETGVCLVRDTGSLNGASLELKTESGMPRVLAAGRFLAPAGGYFDALLGEPVAEDELVSAAIGEIERGARWVKVIADFPDLAAGTDAQPTYPPDRIAHLVTEVHRAGARVAVHSTLDNVAALVAAGVDSIEHGLGMDARVLKDMARRGTAWTPTVSAMTGLIDSADVPEARRRKFHEHREALGELLPLAVRLGVPVLAGTDCAGTLPEEVMLLARLGLEPKDAIAAASVWPRRFLVASTTADIVTYDHDPREDPEELARPAAVVIGGRRLR